MDTHAAPAPRRNYAARLIWAAIILAAALLLFFSIAYAVNSSKVASVTLRLRDPEASARAAAVKELGEMGPRASSTIPALLDLFRNDPSDEVRNAVGDALWRIGPDTSAGLVWLRSKLDDPDPAVRMHAAFILGCDRPNQLLAYVNLQKPWVEQAVAALVPATEDKDKLVRWMAVTGIMRYAGLYATAAVPALIRALGDEDDAIRDNATIALGRIGPPAHAAVPALVAEIKRPYPPADESKGYAQIARAEVRKLTAGSALGRIGGAAVPELIALLRDPDKNIRRAALMAFPYAGTAAVPALAELLRDPDGKVRQSAAEALGKYGEGAGAAEPALTRALNDDDDDVVLSVILALSGLGPNAKPAVPALLEVGLDEKRPEFTRVTAVWAALAIAPEVESSVPARLVGLAKERQKEFEEFSATFESRDAGKKVNPMYR